MSHILGATSQAPIQPQIILCNIEEFSIRNEIDPMQIENGANRRKRLSRWVCNGGR